MAAGQGSSPHTAGEEHPGGFIRFVGPDDFEYEAGWTGPWPPPEKLTIAIGSLSGIVTVVDAAMQEETLMRELEAATTIDVFRYRLRNASVIPDEEAATMTHVVRGAEYVPEDS